MDYTLLSEDCTTESLKSTHLRRTGLNLVCLSVFLSHQGGVRQAKKVQEKADLHSA